MMQKRITQQQLQDLQRQLNMNMAKLEYIKAVLQIDARARKNTDLEAWVQGVLQTRSEYEKIVQQRTGTKTQSSSYHAPHNMKIIVKK